MSKTCCCSCQQCLGNRRCKTDAGCTSSACRPFDVTQPLMLQEPLMPPKTCRLLLHQPLCNGNGYRIIFPLFIIDFQGNRQGVNLDQRGIA
jgi:hypothetical protein